jgi:peptidoglycan/LPS O-acetylase OafA/YrhL
LGIFNFTLSRKTSSNTFIAEIDGLRFIAIITVLIYHLNTVLIRNVEGGFEGQIFKETYQELGWWIIRLDLGVKVFFAISGFILALPFIKAFDTQKQIDIKSYFIRRVTRLEPPFLISLFVLFILQVVILKNDFASLWSNLLASLVYMHGFIFGEPSKINPVTWSLETEFQFYILMPIFMWFLFKNKHIAFSIAGLIVLSLLAYLSKAAIINLDIKFLSHSLLVHLGNFLTGISFALIYYKKPDWIKQKNILFDLIGFLAIFMLFKYYKPQAYISNSIVFNMAILLLFTSVFKGKLLNFIFTRQFIYTIGGMCYSIYLIHYALLFVAVPFTISITQHLDYKLQLLLQSFIHLPIVLLVSSVFFILFERPFMDKNWPEKFRQWRNLYFNKNKS